MLTLVNISNRFMGLDFGAKIIEAYESADSDGNLKVPIEFETASHGTWLLKRISDLVRNKNASEITIFGSGSYTSSDEPDQKVRIELGLYALTREGRILF